MNKINLTDSGQDQMAKEMRARLIDIEESNHTDYNSQLGKVEGMLIVWLIRMGEHNER